MSPYDTIAKVYDKLFIDKQSLAENQEIIEMIYPHLYGKIMDIGCGTGLLIDYVNIPPKKYIGVDPSISMLNQLIKKHPEYQGSVMGCKYEFLDAYRLNPTFVISLFGSISYVNQWFVERIPWTTKKYFLMFYKYKYHPVTYKKTGVEIPHYHYTMKFLKEAFETVVPFNNFIIATNI